MLPGALVNKYPPKLAVSLPKLSFGIQPFPAAVECEVAFKFITLVFYLKGTLKVARFNEILREQAIQFSD